MSRKIEHNGGKGIHCYTFSNDPNERAIAAKQGSKYEWGILIHDSDWFVRSSVAEFSSEEYQTKLLKDESSCVRYTIATHGTLQHRLILKNDNNEDVKLQALTLIKKEK